MAPQAWKPSPRRSRPSLRLAMVPQWPARPRTAVIWIPKATDGTLALKTLAAPQPAQSSSSNGASVASQAEDSSYLDGTSGLKTLAAPQPAQSSSSNGATVASQAQDSSYMDSESDGWHLRLENPRPGPVFVQHWRLRGQPRPGQQLYGFRKRRTAAWKPSPRLSWPSLRLAMVPQWPARPRTAVIWIPKATDGTSALKALAAPQPAQSSSSNAFLGLERLRRASAGPFFVQQWRYSGQPGPGQQL